MISILNETMLLESGCAMITNYKLSESKNIIVKYNLNLNQIQIALVAKKNARETHAFPKVKRKIATSWSGKDLRFLLPQ